MRVSFPLAVATLFALGAVVHAQASPSAPQPAGPRAPEWVVTPGQESVVVAMLGGDDPIAGCHYENARIQKSVIVVTFECSGTAGFTVELGHREGGECTGACSRKFVVSVVRGTPPPAFLPALVASMSRHESRFVWRAPARANAPASPLAWARAHWLPIVGGIGLVLFAGAAVVQRRRQPT